MRTFCESESESGGKSAKRDRVAVDLPTGVFTALVLSPLGLPVLFPRHRHLLTRLVQYCFQCRLIVCLCVWRSPFHFESVTLCVCERNILTSNCEQKRTLHFSMTKCTERQHFWMTNCTERRLLHFWMTKCTERRLLLLGGSAKRDLSVMYANFL